MTTTTPHKICIDLDGQWKEIPHVGSDGIRIHVGLQINLNYQNKQIFEQVCDKIVVCNNNLKSSKLTPYDALLGCLHYWWLSLRRLVPTLSLDYKISAVANLHAAILPKLKVIRTFLIVIRSTHPFLGGLDLRLLEVESIAQLFHHLITL